MTLKDCVKSGKHLQSCDRDGYCNVCGYQETSVLECKWMDFNNEIQIGEHQFYNGQCSTCGVRERANCQSTTKKVSEAIEKMREELERTYGQDFAFTIRAEGQIIAANDFAKAEFLRTISATNTCHHTSS